MADPLLEGNYPMKNLYQALGIAAMCLQEEADTRPYISDVVIALEYLSSDKTAKLEEGEDDEDDDEASDRRDTDEPGNEAVGEEKESWQYEMSGARCLRLRYTCTSTYWLQVL